MESSEPTDSSQRNIIPPGSIPPPKMPPPTRLDPGSLPSGHDKPDGQQPLPPDIDWKALDDKMQNLIEEYRLLLKLLGSLSWDQFVEYMRKHFGNTTLGNRDDFDNWFRVYSRDKVHEWFESRYPNLTIEQYRTFLQRLYEKYGEDIWKIFEKEYYPSDVPDNETPQEGPSDRDRDRALERWERQNY